MDHYSPSQISTMDHRGSCGNIDHEYFAFLKNRARLMRFAMALFFVFGSSLFLTQGSWATSAYNYKTIIDQYSEDGLVITGRLVNKKGQPLKNVAIHVTIGDLCMANIYTDDEGYFMFVHNEAIKDQFADLSFYNHSKRVYIQSEDEIDLETITVDRKRRLPRRAMGKKRMGGAMF